MKRILDHLRNSRFLEQFVLLSKEEAAEIADLLEGKIDKEEMMSDLEKRIEATKQETERGYFFETMIRNQLAIMESLARMEANQNMVEELLRQIVPYIPSLDMIKEAVKEVIRKQP